jgi:hypothetical protein
MHKEYTKPTVTQVDLVPSEAVLGACKSVSGLIDCILFSICGRLFECNTVGS